MINDVVIIYKQLKRNDYENNSFLADIYVGYFDGCQCAECSGIRTSYR